MKRRIVLVVLLGALVVGASAARAFAHAQNAAPQVPPDRVSLEEFKTLRAEGKVLVLDVRVGATTKIKGATYIPLDQLEAHLSELPRDREIVTYCS
ncbi:MAG TPA: rhodanese-like domain-containing protein [Pyrinomonadaceae bacterium]|jgi:ABC-type transporter Mla subunit MlaD|nr:rhodanese-like domain-containing protein [Pyrinomonadaceae bacterium]